MPVEDLQSPSMFIERVLKYLKRWRNNMGKGCTCHSLPSEYSVCDLPLNLHSQSEQPKWHFRLFAPSSSPECQFYDRSVLESTSNGRAVEENLILGDFSSFGAETRQRGDAGVCLIATTFQVRSLLRLYWHGDFSCDLPIGPGLETPKIPKTTILPPRLHPVTMAAISCSPCHQWHFFRTPVVSTNVRRTPPESSRIVSTSVLFICLWAHFFSECYSITGSISGTVDQLLCNYELCMMLVCWDSARTCGLADKGVRATPGEC